MSVLFAGSLMMASNTWSKRDWTKVSVQFWSSFLVIRNYFHISNWHIQHTFMHKCTVTVLAWFIKHLHHVGRQYAFRGTKMHTHRTHNYKKPLYPFRFDSHSQSYTTSKQQWRTKASEWNCFDSYGSPLWFGLVWFYLEFLFVKLQIDLVLQT